MWNQMNETDLKLLLSIHQPPHRSLQKHERRQRLHSESNIDGNEL